jgi:hypothetical protein
MLLELDFVDSNSNIFNNNEDLDSYCAVFKFWGDLEVRENMNLLLL